MSFWGPPLPNGQGNATNQPPANPAHQGPPNASLAPANALGLGFQTALPFSFAPPANNPGPQPHFNSFGTNANNVGPQPSANPFGITAGNPVAAHAASSFNQARQQAPANNDDDSDESDSDDEDPDNVDPDLIDDSSPVEFRLSVPIDVSGNNNVIAIDASKFADLISKSMIDTLRSMIVGNSGIPMIDENGRPRPVNLKVNCKVKVRGHKNIVGEKAVLSLIPAPIRQAMVDNALPISPLSPRENKVLTEQIELGREGLRNTDDRTGGMAYLADGNGAGSSTEQYGIGQSGVGVADQKKRERTSSVDEHGAGSSAEQVESSPKRPRV